MGCDALLWATAGVGGSDPFVSTGRRRDGPRRDPWLRLPRNVAVDHVNNRQHFRPPPRHLVQTAHDADPRRPSRTDPPMRINGDVQSGMALQIPSPSASARSIAQLPPPIRQGLPFPDGTWFWPLGTPALQGTASQRPEANHLSWPIDIAIVASWQANETRFSPSAAGAGA